MEPGAPQGSYDSWRKWGTCLTLFLGTLAVALSATSLNVAIPSIMSSLGASLNRIQWVLTAFMITRTVLIPSTGWLGDRLGDRNLFIVSTALFTAGSLLCSISWDADSLIFFRVIQGVGAGPLMGVSMAIMFEAFPPHERGLAMGLFMTGWSLGPFFGPLVGGYLTEHVHWRAIFYLNLPAGLLSIASAYFILPRTRTVRGSPLDFLGCVTMTAGVVLLLLGLTLGQEYGWSSRFIVGALSGALASFVLFVIVELNVKHPFVEVRFFRSFDFSLANLIIFFRVLGFRGANFLISIFLQRSLNYSPTQAGIFMLPGAVITGVVSPLAGIVSDRLGPRVPMIAGFAVLILTLYGLSNLTLWSTTATIFILLSFKSFGQSSLNAPLNAVALNLLPEGKARMGSGIIGTARGLGEAFGIAIMTSLLERYTFLNLSSMTPAQRPLLAGETRQEALAHIGGLLRHAGEYGSALRMKAESLLGYTLLNEALTRAYQDIFLLIALLYAVLALCVPFLHHERRKAPQDSFAAEG